jgi:L-iditol 2-dehydrogenase
MRAAVYRGIRDVRCMEVETPTIGDNEALVKVRAAAICGTDVKIYRYGHRAIKGEGERVLGHEFSGEIAELGENVEGYKVGMRVGVEPNFGCGRCRVCRNGLISYCDEYNCLGITVDGGFSEYVKINESTLIQGNMVPFDETVDFDEAALAEPLACCINGFESVGTKPGDYVVIVGAGPIGILHLQISRVAGASRVIVADVSEERLHFAERFKPDIVINSGKEDLLESVLRHTGGRGADVVITACPVASVQSMAVLIAGKLGRVLLFGGLPKGSDSVAIDTNAIHYNGITVTGTTGSNVSQYEKALELITERKIDTKSLISKRFDISQINEALEYAESGRGLKTVIEFES